MSIWFAPKVYHKREGYAVGKVQFSDFGNDFQVRCTKLALEIASGRETFSGEHEYDVISFAFSPDGRYMAAGGRSATVQVWDLESGQIHQALAVGAISPQVEAIAYSPDGTRLAIADIMFDAATGQEQFWLRGHTHGILHLAFNADGTRLITASYDGTARGWDITPAHELFARSVHGGMVYDVAYSPDGALMATAGRDGSAIVWAAESGDALQVLADHTDVVNGVAFSPDGQLLATTSADLSVILWDTATGQKLRTLIGHDADRPGGVPMFRGVMAASFSPQCLGTAGAPSEPCPLATVGMDGQFIVWDAATGQRLFNYQEAIGGLKSVAFSPDGKRLATVDFRGVGKVWDVATGEPLVELAGPPSGFSVTYCATETRLVTGSGEGTITLWDAQSGLPLLTVGGHRDPVGGIACSPDGSYLATAGFDGTTRVFVVEADRLLALARSRLTRPFTLEECQKYLHTEECPAAP